jgi:hypothetical protein
MDLRYKLLSGQTGRGELANISSSGLLFRCNSVFPKRELIEIELAWPSSKDGEPLHLCVHGLILRSDAAGTVVAIAKYEFRAPEVRP